MQQQEPEFLGVLKSLDAEGARFVIVGGVAMVLHGSSSVTFDLDLALSLDERNVAAAIRGLAPFHPRPPHYPATLGFVWDERSFVGPAIELNTDAGPVDLLRVLPEVDSFEGLWDRSEVRQLGSLEVRVASIGDLLAMKEAANRPKDQEHVRQLRALQKLRQESVGGPDDL